MVVLWLFHCRLAQTQAKVPKDRMKPYRCILWGGGTATGTYCDHFPYSLCAGIAVPSLTSFAYYAVFLVLLVLWSVHLRPSSLVRVLRTYLILHSALHLLVLHLFQFSTAQNHIQLGPCSIANCTTTDMLLARSVSAICRCKTNAKVYAQLAGISWGPICVSFEVQDYVCTCCTNSVTAR